jgi:hypothetical protein
MIKIYVGGVSAISGEPATEVAATKLRRQKKQADGSRLHDYSVAPTQQSKICCHHAPHDL